MSADDENEHVMHALKRWASRITNPPPAWWEWAVACAQFHQPTCDWVTVGISREHCSCSLTRVIAQIIEETKRDALRGDLDTGEG